MLLRLGVGIELWSNKDAARVAGSMPPQAHQKAAHGAKPATRRPLKGQGLGLKLLTYAGVYALAWCKNINAPRWYLRAHQLGTETQAKRLKALQQVGIGSAHALRVALDAQFDMAAMLRMVDAGKAKDL